LLRKQGEFLEFFSVKEKNQRIYNFMQSFLEYTMNIDKAHIKKLRLISKLLKKDGLRVDEFEEESEPYIYLYSTVPDTSFSGVRIYMLGDLVGFRVAKQYDTEPYGTAYSFAIQNIYEELLDDQGKKKLDPEILGKKLVSVVGQQMRKFFKESHAAEEYEISAEIQSRDAQKNNKGTVVVQDRKWDLQSKGPINMTAGPNAYANTVFSRNY
jgi:hypothetical protein